jgi:hypothetical protein
MAIEQASRIYVDPTQGWSFAMQGPNGTSVNHSGGWGSLEVYPVSSLSGTLHMPASLTGLEALVFGSKGSLPPTAAPAAGGAASPTGRQPAARPWSDGMPAAAPRQVAVEATSVRAHMNSAGRSGWDVADQGDLDLGHGDPFERLRRSR